jgi:hypothetical protein
MSWRDFKPSTPMDKIDKIDIMPPDRHIVDIVDIVERGNSKKETPPPVVNNKPDTEDEVNNRLATPPEIVQPDPIVEAVWVNPHTKGTLEARRESLMAVMEAIWTKEFQGIINKTLSGKQQIADFQKAVDAWGRMVKVG